MAASQAAAAPVGKPIAPSAVLPPPEVASGKPRRGLGLLGKQAFSRAAPALPLRPKTKAAAVPPPVDGLASLIALARAGSAGTSARGPGNDPIALLRDELLGLLALAEEPPEAPDVAPTP